MRSARRPWTAAQGQLAPEWNARPRWTTTALVTPFMLVMPELPWQRTAESSPEGEVVWRWDRVARSFHDEHGCTIEG